jgi:hypothetical protein
MPEVDWLPLMGVLLVIASSFTLLINPAWQTSLVALSIQYLGVFILVSNVLPLGIAAVKLVAGWMAGIVLAMSISGLLRRVTVPSDGSAISRDSLGQSHSLAGSPGWQTRSGRAFRLLTGLLVGMAGLSLAPQLAVWVPKLNNEQAWGSVILLGVGLLQLGFTIQPLRTILGLLTFLAGFEIIYAPVEPSALVAGLLAVIHLGLALAGAYLLMVDTLEESA